MQALQHTQNLLPTTAAAVFQKAATAAAAAAIALLRSRPPTPQLPPLLNWFIDNFIEKSPALTHALNRNPIMDGDSYFMHVGVGFFCENIYKCQTYINTQNQVA